MFFAQKKELLRLQDQIYRLASDQLALAMVLNVTPEQLFEVCHDRQKVDDYRYQYMALIDKRLSDLKAIKQELEDNLNN